jgi:hypothetical protein
LLTGIHRTSEQRRPKGWREKKLHVITDNSNSKNSKYKTLERVLPPLSIFLQFLKKTTRIRKNKKQTQRNEFMNTEKSGKETIPSRLIEE